MLSKLGVKPRLLSIYRVSLALKIDIARVWSTLKTYWDFCLLETSAGGPVRYLQHPSVLNPAVTHVRMADVLTARQRYIKASWFNWLKYAEPSLSKA